MVEEYTSARGMEKALADHRKKEGIAIGAVTAVLLIAGAAYGMTGEFGSTTSSDVTRMAVQAVRDSKKIKELESFSKSTSVYEVFSNSYVGLSGLVGKARDNP